MSDEEKILNQMFRQLFESEEYKEFYKKRIYDILAFGETALDQTELERIVCDFCTEPCNQDHCYTKEKK